MPGVKQQIAASNAEMDRRIDVAIEKPDFDRQSTRDWGAKKFKRGTLSGIEFQQLMNTVSTDAPKLGTRNASRAMTNNLSRDSLMPEPYSAEITMWDMKNSRQVKDQMHFLIPYEVIENQENVDEYTTIPDGSPLVETRAEWATRTNETAEEFIVTGLWGDSGTFFTRDSVYLLLWSCLSGLDHPRRFICAFAKRQTCACGCFGRHTFDDIFKVIAWMYGTFGVLCSELECTLGLLCWACTLGFLCSNLRGMTAPRPREIDKSSLKFFELPH